MKHKEIKLDAYEQEIENSEEYRPLSKRNKMMIGNILEKEKKAKSINIRISQYDLERIKEQSAKEGLPYQTLITSIIHKYITNQLIDENSVLKTLKILRNHR